MCVRAEHRCADWAVQNQTILCGELDEQVGIVTYAAVGGLYAQPDGGMFVEVTGPDCARQGQSVA